MFGKGSCLVWRIQWLLWDAIQIVAAIHRGRKAWGVGVTALMIGQPGMMAQINARVPVVFTQVVQRP